MTTRIESGGPATGIHSTPTAPRLTPAPERPFKNVMAAGASAVVRGAEAAVEKLPGGPILAAAFRPTRPSPGASETRAPAARRRVRRREAGPTEHGWEPPTGDVLGQADLNMQYLAFRSVNRRAANTRDLEGLKARHDTIKTPSQHP